MVCPACAGMIRMPPPISVRWLSLPRMRGDDPEPGFYKARTESCLPRMRGDDPDDNTWVMGENAFAPHARG